MKVFINVFFTVAFLLFQLNVFSQDLKALEIDEKAKLLTKKLDQFLDLNAQQNEKIEQIYLQYLNDFYFILNKEEYSNSIIVKREQDIEYRLTDYIKRTLNKTQREKYLMLLAYMKE